jgi:hypothetical protein
MQNRKQRRIDQQALRISYQLFEDGAPQRLQVTPELANPAVERRRVNAQHPREQMREKSLGIAQERALALDAPQLLQEGERDDLRVRKALYGLVVPSFRIENGVRVVDEAEKHGDRFFQADELWGMLGLGHPVLLWTGRSRMASFLSQHTLQHTSSVCRPGLWALPLALWRVSVEFVGKLLS